MIIVDIVLVLLILAVAHRGWKDGLLPTLGRLLGVIIGFVLAKYASPYAANLAGLFWPGYAGTAQVVSFLVVFAVAEGVIAFGFRFLGFLFKIITKLPFFSSIDKILGGVLGFIEGALMIGSAVYVVVLAKWPLFLLGWFSQSRIAAFTQYILSRFFHVVL